MRRAGQWLAAALLAWASLAGCAERPAPYAPQFGPAPAGQKPSYSFGIHPLHNPRTLFQIYGPMVDRLNARIPQARFRLEASRSYADFERKLERRELDLALPNPWQTLRSLRQGYRVIAKMGEDSAFRGTILVRRDSGIRELSQLKGRSLSAPSATALAAAMMPFFLLQSAGVAVGSELAVVFVGSQESSIESVFQHKTDAGATWPVPWRGFQAKHPAEAAELLVLAETEPLVNNGVVVRDDLPAWVGERFGEELVRLSQDEEGRALLASIPLAEFELATAKTYEPVARFLDLYASKVGPPGAVPGAQPP